MVEFTAQRKHVFNTPLMMDLEQSEGFSYKNNIFTVGMSQLSAVTVTAGGLNKAGRGGVKKGQIHYYSPTRGRRTATAGWIIKGGDDPPATHHVEGGCGNTVLPASLLEQRHATQPPPPAALH